MYLNIKILAHIVIYKELLNAKILEQKIVNWLFE